MYWNARVALSAVPACVGLTLTWDVLKPMGGQIPPFVLWRLTLTWDVLKQSLFCHLLIAILINFNMGCIETALNSSEKLSTLRLTLTWDVLKRGSKSNWWKDKRRLTLTWDVLKLLSDDSYSNIAVRLTLTWDVLKRWRIIWRCNH